MTFAPLFRKYRSILLYGCSLAVLLFLLKWFQWKFVIIENAIEIYVGLIALFFTILGAWVAKQLTRPVTKTIIVEKEIHLPPADAFIRNEAELEKLNLTGREWDVLQLMATGKSNAEIAGSLFLSVSTVKTHVSNIFVKMDVKSRTQAMEKAKRLKIIA